MPVDLGSCSGAYCSHVLEHLALEDCRKALKNTYNILANGGVFRFVLPDLEIAINKYIESSSEDAAALEFIKNTTLGQVKRDRSIREFIIAWLGNSQHRWMWDYNSIKLELETIGFIKIRRAMIGDSNIKLFGEVENIERWKNSLGVHCEK